MKKNCVFTALITLVMIGSVPAQKTSEDDLSALVKGLIPSGANFVHKVVKGSFAESASADKSAKIVALYKTGPGSSTTGYDIIIMTPDGDGEFAPSYLSAPEFTWSIMEPVAVFFENVDKDSDRELLILEKCMTGIGPTGAQYFYRTRVYDWDSDDFRHLEWVSEKIGSANTAAAVRNKLPGIIKGDVQTGPAENLITSLSVGAVRIGMTVAEVRTAVKPWTLHRSSDGEGVALIDIRQRDDVMMTLYAGDQDQEDSINENAVVELIETRSAFFRTAEGAVARMKLEEIEKIYGGLKEIMMSEIESREYAKFENQPEGIEFRVMGADSDAGKYKDGENTSKEFSPGAYVFSIIALKPGSDPESAVIEIPDGTNTAVAEGFLGEKGDTARYLVNAKAGYRLRATIFDVESPDEEGPVMVGYIKSPAGSGEGSPGGLFYDGVLKESGNYEILVKQNEAKSGSANIKFKVKIELREAAGDAADNKHFEKLDIAARNRKIDKAAGENETWVRDPFLVLANIIEPFSEMGSRKVEMASEYADVADSVKVTVIDDGYADDSVRGEKFVFELKVNGSGVWKVVSGEKAQRCWQGRGHEDYSSAPCI